MKPGASISIVIPVFNQLHYTRDCLASLAETISNGVELVVVNNGSRDGTAEFLAGQAGIKVIHNPENRGCAAAWNQGVDAATGEWIVVLNNDVLLSAGWLEGLVGFAAAEEVGVASPAIREGELNYDLAGYAREFIAKMRDVTRWGVANGICFLVHRRVFQSVGRFDEQFRIGQFEDADFFLRARRAGFRLGMTGSSFIHHFGSITQNALRREPGTRPYELENRAYFRAKWRLGWWRRRGQRLREKAVLARWRLLEHWRHGHSLHEKWLDGGLRFY